ATGMTGTALLAAIAIGTIAGAHVLSRARWPWRTPRTAIVLWQTLGLAWGVASIGALLGFAVAPYARGILGGLAQVGADVMTGRLGGRLDPPHLVALLAGLALAAVLLIMQGCAIYEVVRARSRHRALLNLVAHGEPSVPGALVVDHPAAAAYCVPGVRSSKVVISAGTLALLDRAELAAVLAHERAHVRERHDLVLLPFTSLRQVFPRLGLVGRALDAVKLLIEMTADDRALRHRSPRELATALLRFASAHPADAPSGALAAVSADEIPVMARVNRLLRPVRPHPAARATMLAAAALLAVVPLLLYAFPR
ncbi:MAG TPA: M56 family metallopeptidase, partial [Streptosporangiaceae bacterium]